MLLRTKRIDESDIQNPITVFILSAFRGVEPADGVPFRVASEHGRAEIDDIILHIRKGEAIAAVPLSLQAGTRDLSGGRAVEVDSVEGFGRFGEGGGGNQDIVEGLVFRGREEVFEPVVVCGGIEGEGAGHDFLCFDEAALDVGEDVGVVDVGFGVGVLADVREEEVASAEADGGFGWGIGDIGRAGGGECAGQSDESGDEKCRGMHGCECGI